MSEAPEKPQTSALRVGLTLGGIVLAAVVIFGLGVMEGSRVTERAPVAAVTAAPPSPPPAVTPKPVPAPPLTTAAPAPPDKLTFYDRLSGVAPAAPLAPPAVPPPAPGLAAGQPPAPRAPTRQPDAPASPEAGGDAPKKAADPEATASAAKPKMPSKSDPAAQIRKLSGKGRYTVQMAAVTERAAAEQTASLIKRNGFDAVTVMASVKGKIWYRIRVGTFPNKQAATQAAAIFRSAFGLNAIPTEN